MIRVTPFFSSGGRDPPEVLIHIMELLQIAADACVRDWLHALVE